MVAEILETLATDAAGILFGAQKLSGSGGGDVVLPPTLKPFAVGALGNFPYYWQNPANLKFNHLTYGWISANLKAGALPIQLDQSFINYYIEALASVSYQLSTADQAQLTKAQQNAVNQQFALLSAWQAAYGSIPSGTATQQPIDIIINSIATNWAIPPTTLTAMQSSPDLNALLNNLPASGATILPVLKNYLSALGSSISLQNASTMNTGYLQQALAAVQTPTAASGALTTDNGLVNPAYLVSTPLADIIDGLNQTSNSVTLNMLISPNSADGYSVSVNNSSPIKVAADEFFSLFIDDHLDYFKNLVAAGSAPVQLEMTFSGVTMVNYGPVSYNISTGQNWYWMQPILNALQNGGSDVSGFKFSPLPQIDFSAPGPFGYLSGVGISNYPSVKLTAAGAAYSSLAKTFDQPASFEATFLGVPLNNDLNQTYSIASEIDDSDSTATITLNPTRSPNQPSTNSVAWVLGVQTVFPALVDQ